MRAVRQQNRPPLSILPDNTSNRTSSTTTLTNSTGGVTGIVGSSTADVSTVGTAAIGGTVTTAAPRKRGPKPLPRDENGKIIRDVLRVLEKFRYL